MNSMRIKKGDTVKVIAGKDKDKTGVVQRAIPTKHRVVIEGVNQVKKAMRPTQSNPSGGISTINAPMDVSNVMLMCPNCNQPTRVGMNVSGDKKIRVCKKCGKDIDK